MKKLKQSIKAFKQAMAPEVALMKKGPNNRRPSKNPKLDAKLLELKRRFDRSIFAGALIGWWVVSKI